MTPLPADNGDLWLSLSEAAASLGISAPTLSVLVKKGRIKHTRHGRSVYLLRSVVEEFRKLDRPRGRPKKI